ncbi:MFS general substrate transporter [Cryphonectria parasitica EP155]|uniref:MFS general substrate transporter n=1 Tax=Cryphonectria parasitica (strain ATCC 38755 / EP155) TaxID=660469 RepID=A0A9P5CNL4_CRYP1|nr:MFS general substrate transporter [Cryphonectria parasitica EP155]KAF3764447.1 MFS general substrate transporter [Cryphonectria parasitica EP155]
MATQTAIELQTFEPTISILGAPQRKSYETPAELEAPPAGSTTSEEAAAAATTTTTDPLLPKGRAIIVITQVCGLTFFSSFCNGIVVVALPAMQSALGLQEGLLVWPTSSFYLTAGSCLLLAGSVADVAGTKRVNLIGSLLSAVFALACGLSRTGGELIAFRALQGVTNAIITPSSISIISNSVEEGRPRNMGFACMGFGQPLGFSLGLILAGVFTDTVGWRPAFYLPAAASFALFLIGIWALPQDTRPGAGESIWKRVASEIDWVGVLLASAGLASLSYVLASLSADINSIHKASSIVLLVISGLSVLLFVGWMSYQVKNNRTALIPNSLWRSHVFTSSCIMVLLTNALTNCMELYSSLFFQQVQGTSALGASLRVLPSLIAGALTNISTGIFVNRMSVLWTVLISSVMSTTAPLLMALTRADQLYWENAFFAQILTPISCDLLFTVGLLIVSDVFPKHMQARGGAVFNTCAQLGTAIGLSVTQVIASSVTDDSSYADKSSPDALMEGYRVAFWTMFGWMAAVCVACVVGLRRVGGIGVKRD